VRDMKFKKRVQVVRKCLMRLDDEAFMNALFDIKEDYLIHMTGYKDIVERVDKFQDVLEERIMKEAK